MNNIINADRPLELETYNLKGNGTITQAIKTYESYNVPLKQLLTDYNDVITYPEYLKKAFNAWEYLNKGIKKIPIVCGVSVAEALFNVSAMSLHKQKPIEVIKNIYYRSKSRNDSGLENYFLSVIKKDIFNDEKLFIINPSPIIVEFFERNRCNNHYAVIDKTLAELYTKQYKNSKFLTLDTMSQITEVDTMLLFGTNVDEKSIEKILECVNTISSKKICGIIQTRLIDNKESCFWKSIMGSGLNIREIVLVPNSMSNSSPKKKCMVYLERKEKKEQTKIWKVDFEEDTKLVVPSERKLFIDQEELFKYNTLNLMWKKAFEVSDKEKETKAEYATADLYPFSKEIQLSYSIYSEKKVVYGKVYYAATKNRDIPSIRGKALTKRIEKGLRRKTAEEVINALEELPYNPQVFDAIKTDITTHYLKAHLPVSLKTLWFCLRDELQKKNSYDESLMRQIFTTGEKISELVLQKSNEKMICEAITELIEPGEEKKELQILKMLNIVVTEAIKQGYLSENKILPLLPNVQNRATKRQNQVRQALAKRSFENIEEEKIIKYLKSFYVERSSYMAVLIRLLTGISLKEDSALLWRNFQYNKSTDVYTLSITKFVDNSGKMISHALEESWEKYRTLPISTLLGNILEERKKFLIRKGLAAQVLENYPIILGREDLNKMLKGHKEEFCKPTVIAQKCRESISKAEIVQNMLILPDEESGTELETDINSYGGDIFKTNFREKALNAAGFSLDEVNYYLGIKKPDTFSQHYCDYTNDYVQLIMARKLDRWQNKYFSKLFIEQKKTDMMAVHGEVDFTGIYEGVSGSIIERHALDQKPEIEVENRNGFKIIVSSYVLR